MSSRIILVVLFAGRLQRGGFQRRLRRKAASDHGDGAAGSRLGGGRFRSERRTPCQAGTDYKKQGRFTIETQRRAVGASRRGRYLGRFGLGGLCVLCG